MTTQVQMRGTTEASQSIRTLASRELDINTTDYRINLHNGSKAGGVPHINCYDQQNSEFSYAAASGTNALTATLRETPTGYITGAMYIIKIASNNTGSVTLNLNSQGSKTLKKIKSGALSNLETGDLIAGTLMQVLYDGTYFQVVTGLGSNALSRQSWVPTSVTSYTSSDCVYVEHGDSVTVSFRVVMTSDTAIGGFPFSSETQCGCVVFNTFGSTGSISDKALFAQLSGDVMTIETPTDADGDTITGCITYVKN